MRAQKFWNSRKLGPEIFWTQIGKSSEMSIDIDHQMARQIWHRTATNSTTIIRKINTHSLNILVSEFCEVNKCIPYEVPNLVLVFNQILWVNWATSGRFQIDAHWMASIGKVECVFPMAVVSMLPHAEFGPNDAYERSPNKLFRALQLWAGRLIRRFFLDYTLEIAMKLMKTNQSFLLKWMLLLGRSNCQTDLPWMILLLESWRKHNSYLLL